MTTSVPKNKLKLLTFAITLVGLYLITGRAVIGLLQQTPQPFFGTVGIAGAVSVIQVVAISPFWTLQHYGLGWCLFSRRQNFA